MYLKNLLLFGALLLCSSLLSAQELSKSDSLGNELVKTNQELKLLKMLKVSGYLQGQYQIADSSGISSYSGGNFPTGSDKRFAVRRGRVKFTFANQLSQVVTQFDITEKGVSTKDAYLMFKEPIFEWASFKVGVFDRFFGNEITYSSSSRESPERGRMSQILFPGERDCGAAIIINPPKTSPYNFLKLEMGMFNGTGFASDFDKQKDFIARLSLLRATTNQKIKYGVGASYYKGGWIQSSTTYYKRIEQLANGTYAFVKNTNIETGVLATRYYKGIDAQLSFDGPLGMTTIRGEFISGIQPGTSSSSVSPATLPSSTSNTFSGNASGTITIPANSSDTTININIPVTGNVTTKTTYSDMYSRNFNGAYFYFIQNIGNTKHQLVLKYDWYDPNTKVKDNQIDTKGVTSANGKLSSADIKYTTIGIGWIYYLDQNIKIVAYYDIVKNESTNISNFTRDVKDNVLTLRVQYKF